MKTTNTQIQGLLNEIVFTADLNFNNDSVSFEIIKDGLYLTASYCLEYEQISKAKLIDEESNNYELSEDNLIYINNFFIEQIDEKRAIDLESGDLYEQMIHDLCDYNKYYTL